MERKILYDFFLSPEPAATAQDTLPASFSFISPLTTTPVHFDCTNTSGTRFSPNHKIIFTTI